ncbi:MAG TPA: hypothetical protein VMV51_01990 [Gemmatimonadaceae bacterium]|nr:hypothetical protein [Gemmatimonadaceae bacterium]
MRARWVAFLLALPALSARAQAPSASVVVRPDTVTVGQPFRVEVRVRAARGAAIVFPARPDSMAGVQALDPRAIANGRAADAADRTATYRLAAWDVGTLGIPLADVVVTVGGTVHRLPLAGITVFVRSVLPADSAARVPKPARALFVAWPIPWWILGVLALIAFLLWLSWRRRRGGVEPAAAGVPPFERAQRAFTHVAALELVEAGERGRYVALMVDVLRDYLAERFPLAARSLTTPELTAEVRDAATIPGERLGRLLHEADLIKFARRPLAAAQALALGDEARAIVAHEHVASTPAPATEAA